MRRARTALAIVSCLLATGSLAKPFKTEFKSKFVEFEYGWSSEANAIPALVKRFAADMRKQRSSLTASARADAAERRKQGFPFNAYSQVTSITTAGQSLRLLSLKDDTYAFTGGAHGNSGTTALLWDRKVNRESGINTLFATAAQFPAVTRTFYCKKLDAERLKRREGHKPDLPDFNA